MCLEVCVEQQRWAVHTLCVQNLTTNASPHLSAYLSSGTEVGGVGGLTAHTKKKSLQSKNPKKQMNVKVCILGLPPILQRTFYKAGTSL